MSASALPHFDAVPLFQCLNPEERALLAPVSRVVVYEKGEDLTATTVESAIRVMSRWGKENVVITGPDGFSIPDLQALQAVTRD